jgi:hypothetical protein
VIVFSPAAIPTHGKRAMQVRRCKSRLEKEDMSGFEPGGCILDAPDF